MRRSINIPDEYYIKIMESLGERGFNTMSDFLLDLIRKDQHPIGAESHETASAPVDNHIETKPDKSLSGRKGTCPVCYEVTPIELAQQHYQKSHGDI